LVSRSSIDTAVELLDRLGEQGRRRDPEPRVLHMLAERRILATQGAQEREDVFVDHPEHIARFELLESRPAQIGVGASTLILPLRKNLPLEGDIERRRLFLLDGLQLVEALDKEQVGNLFDHEQWVRNAARPEIIPDTVDL
jgi:hypothetical protein